jgi:hypothetical protein
MLDNSDLLLPTNDLSSYIEVPEKRGLNRFTVRTSMPVDEFESSARGRYDS